MSKKENDKSYLYNLGIRYLILIIVALPNLFIFYQVFAPLTIYPSFFLFKLLFDVELSGNNFIINNSMNITLIDACIAGAAYYLLLILNLSTRNIENKKRIKLILISFLSFLILNILRIFLLGLMYIYELDYFDITHKVFWYGLSTIFVIGIWFFEVKKYKIKEIPFYSDIKYLLKLSKIIRKNK